MANTALRIAPSGSPLKNDDGGIGVVGEGFPLRVAELASSTGLLTWSNSIQEVPTPAGFLEVTLDNPKPNLRYRAQATLQVSTIIAGSQAYNLYFRYSISGGSYNNEGLWTGAVGAAGDLTFQQLSIVQPATLGANFLVPIPDGATSLTLRLGAQASGNTIQLSNQARAYIALTETL